MAGEWREATLDQLGRIVTGKTPPSSGEGYFGGDIPFVTPTDFDGRRIIDSTGRCLSEEGALAVGSARLPRQAVMVSCIGSDMGKAAIAGHDCVTNQQINSVIVESGDDPLFVYYSLSIRKAELRAIAGGSAQPILNKSDFGRLDINLPPPDEQRAIAHILGTLDDKIELNRRMNETLEAMARALFKSWFVDFDPVHGRADGHDSGTSDALADAFPSAFQDSTLGMIPRGWRAAVVANLAEVVGGSTPSTKERTFWENGTHSWATPKDLSSLATPVLLETERTITELGLGQIGSGLLPRGTVLLSSRAPIGYLAVTEVPVAINQGFIAMLPRPGVSNLFLLYWVESAYHEIVSRANGSTFLEISKSNFRDVPLVAPAPSAMATFERTVRPLYSRIVNNERECLTLARLRDTLLPKLVSGEVRLERVERVLGRSA